VVGRGRQREQRSDQKGALHRRESTKARSRGTPSMLCAPYQEKSRPPHRTTLVPWGSAARNTAASSSEKGCGSSGSSTICGARCTTSSRAMRGYRVSRVPAGRGTAWPRSAASGYMRWRSAKTFPPPPRDRVHVRVLRTADEGDRLRRLAVSRAPDETVAGPEGEHVQRIARHQRDDAPRRPQEDRFALAVVGDPEGGHGATLHSKSRPCAPSS